MLGLDLPHGRLKSVVDPLERGNFKKALTEINKVLKKTPTYAAARVLKALVLLKSGRPSEAADLAEDVIRACPTDESTLSTILCYFRETGQSAREREYLKSALEKCPNREDLLICLFLNQVQAEDFSAQQKTARLLSQQFSSRMYIYWMIVSTLMQADDNPDLGTRMFLPLAEKMLLREAIANKMEKHMEFQLLLDVLDRLGKHNDALDFLDRKELIDRLDESDYRCDYSDKRLELCASLDLWERAFKLAESKLLQSPNHWNAWKCLLDMTVGCDSHELPSSRLTQLYSLIVGLIRDHPKVRGPQLARLDLLASLTKRGQRLPSDANIAQCLSLYLDTFSSKPVCAFDVAYLIPACLPDAVERTTTVRFSHYQFLLHPCDVHEHYILNVWLTAFVYHVRIFPLHMFQFLRTVVDEVEKMDITCTPKLRFLGSYYAHVSTAGVPTLYIALFCLQFTSDSKQTYRHLCVYQIARASGHNIPLGELMRTYLAYAPERKSIANLTQKLGDDHANPGAVDLCPADGFLLLALSSLVEQTDTVCSSIDSFGSTLLAAYWTQYLGISHASNNHHFRLRLCSLFSPHCLACPDLALSQTNRLQIKQLLYVSLGYFLVSPAPMLTLWAGSTPSGPLPDSNPVLGLYQRLHALSGSTVSEAEEGILAAYRRSAYTRVREFTQFAKRLRHADVFLTARLELVYWQVAVMPDEYVVCFKLLSRKSCTTAT
ncbi:N-terminal acetyltransferase B complex non-catalytic subunit [Paragonimus westermani]|uniref:N-terminal acetyltransferase B complex non-catalytic subunit n=1 Tax=Paragonimus westermani TaxID=34504 RepID=A0A5J4N6P8_9TREM|nr:N-terminal acetyltransferase B complex non-catalytic subunit [Paragonimus westermani]